MRLWILVGDSTNFVLSQTLLSFSFINISVILLSGLFGVLLKRTVNEIEE